MAQTIYLAQNEQPHGDKFVLIEEVLGIRGSEAIQHSMGITLRVGPSSLDQTISDAEAKAEGKPTNIFVRRATY